MSELIVDASAVMAVLLNEPERPAIITQTTGKVLISPQCLPWEIGNAFSLALKRSRINLSQTLKALKIFQSIPIRYGNIDLIESLQLASEYNIYAYDAYYLQCAKQFQRSLLTLDRKMQKISEKLGIKIVEIKG